MAAFGAGADELLKISSKLPFTDFEEFTTGLITNVTQALNESNRAQITEYINLIDAVGGTLAEYTQKTIGNLDDAARDYLNNAILPAYGADDDSKVLEPAEITANTEEVNLVADAGKKAELAGVFDGLTIPGANNTQQTWAQATANDTILPQDLLAFGKLQVQRSVGRSYAELKSLVQLGMLRLLPKSLRVKASFLFEATSTDSLTTKTSQYQSEADLKTLNWGLNGSASYKQEKQAKLLKQSFAAAISGNVSSSKSQTKFSVATIDTKSTSNLEAKIQISASVDLEMVADYFPALPVSSTAPPALPA